MDTKQRCAALFIMLACTKHLNLTKFNLKALPEVDICYITHVNTTLLYTCNL